MRMGCTHHTCLGRKERHNGLPYIRLGVMEAAEDCWGPQIDVVKVCVFGRQLGNGRAIVCCLVNVNASYKCMPS